jgi:hypothetical protein
MASPLTRDALNASFRRRLEGSISDGAVTKALQELVDRHEILRTRFRMGADGRLEQEVLREQPFKPDMVDLRHLASPGREAELERLGAGEARKPFAVADGVAPLFRVLLVRLAADLAYVHFTFHQLVIDGWSVDVLDQEFGRLAAAADGALRLICRPSRCSSATMRCGKAMCWPVERWMPSAITGAANWRACRISGSPRSRRAAR